MYYHFYIIKEYGLRAKPEQCIGAHSTIGIEVKMRRSGWWVH